MAAALWAGGTLAQGNEAPPEPIAIESPAEPVTLFEARLDLERLVDEEQYAQAVELGAELLKLTEQEFGPQSEQTAEALIALAEAQTLNEQYDLSEESYLRAVEIYQKIDGVFAPSLVPTLTSLGDNYDAGGQYLNAVSAYNEARLISRRIYGLLNEDQIELLDRMSSTFIELNEFEEANEQQLAALKLIQRNHEPQSTEALNGLYKYAQWLRLNRHHGEEREQYAVAIRIIVQHYGEDSPLLITPLRETANSYRLQGSPVVQGYSNLMTALAIVDAQPEADALTEASLLRDIGDWYVAFQQTEAGAAEYLRAWRLLGTVPNGDELREQWFGTLDYVYRSPMNERSVSNDPDAASGYVLAALDVDTSGRAQNVRIVDADPPGLQDDTVVRHIYASRFRPRIEAGELVTASNLGLRFTYRYKIDEDEPAD